MRFTGSFSFPGWLIIYEIIFFIQYISNPATEPQIIPDPTQHPTPRSCQTQVQKSLSSSWVLPRYIKIKSLQRQSTWRRRLLSVLWDQNSWQKTSHNLNRTPTFVCWKLLRCLLTIFAGFSANVSKQCPSIWFLHPIFCDLSHSKRTVTRLTMNPPWIWVSTWFFIFEKHAVHCTYVARTSRPCVFEQHVILEQPLKILGKFVRLVVLFLRITILPLQQLKDTKGLVLQTMSSLRSVCVSFSTFMWPILEELRAQNIEIKNNMPPEGRPCLSLMTFSDGSGNAGVLSVEPSYL